MYPEPTSEQNTRPKIAAQPKDARQRHGTHGDLVVDTLSPGLDSGATVFSTSELGSRGKRANA